MSKVKSVIITRHKDGSVTLRARGGADLRNFVPEFFKEEQRRCLAGEDEETAEMKTALSSSNAGGQR